MFTWFSVPPMKRTQDVHYHDNMCIICWTEPLVESPFNWNTKLTLLKVKIQRGARIKTFIAANKAAKTKLLLYYAISHSYQCYLNSTCGSYFSQWVTQQQQISSATTISSATATTISSATATIISSAIATTATISSTTQQLVQQRQHVLDQPLFSTSSAITKTTIPSNIRKKLISKNIASPE
ncbi:hypothetical protein ACTFIU_002436 [Dictyostelium citrinum]